MKLTLTLAMDNEAFGNDNKGVEVARILMNLANKVAKEDLFVGDSGMLRDVNGNAVGSWHVIEE